METQSFKRKHKLFVEHLFNTYPSISLTENGLISVKQ